MFPCGGAGVVAVDSFQLWRCDGTDIFAELDAVSRLLCWLLWLGHARDGRRKRGKGRPLRLRFKARLLRLIRRRRLRTFTRRGMSYRGR